MAEICSPGGRIRHLQQVWGTATCLVSFRSDPTRVMMLTASHVLAPDGAGAGDPVYCSDFAADPHDAGSVVGPLAYWTGLDGSANPAEAALAWVDPGKVSPGIAGIGVIADVGALPKVGQALRFAGAASGVRTMAVLALGQSVSLGMATADQWNSYPFTGQILCERADQDGDSGAAVVDNDNAIIGMVVGSATIAPFGDVTVVSPIDAIRHHRQWNGQELLVLSALPAGAVAPPADQPVVPVGIADITLDVLARTLWGEDRGDGEPGMRAVACVILNRVRAQRQQFGLTVVDVCKASKQFSVWNPELAGYQATPDELADYRAMMAAGPATAGFALAQQVARDAVLGRLDDPTAGALFYAASSFIAVKCLDPANARQFYCQGGGVRIGGQTYFHTA